MPTTTKKRLRELFLETVGFFLVTTTTGAGGGGGATAVSANAQNYEDFIVAGMWMYLPGGPNGSSTAEARRITTVSGSTFTPETVFSAQVADAVAIEFLPFHPDWIHAALREGIQKSFPYLYLELMDETLIVDDLLSNSDFETFSGGSFANWTLGGASAADDQETTDVMHGSSSAKLTSASATAQLYQNLTVNVQELVGKTVNFQRWVGAIGANIARIGFEFASGVTDYHAFHTGQGAAFGNNVQWEWQSHQAVVPTTVEYIRCICEVATGTKIGLFDGPGGAWVGRKLKYTVPTSFVGWPRLVEIQDQLDPNGRYVKMNARPKSGRLLRLGGEGRLSVPSAETDTVEIDETQAALVTALARVEFYRRFSSIDPTGEFQERLSESKQEANRLTASASEGGVAMARGGVHLPNDWWTQREDSSGRYLILALSLIHI